VLYQFADWPAQFEAMDRNLPGLNLGRYAAVVGTLEPRKNLRFLLSLMPALAAKGYRLVIVGCSGWGRSDLAEMLQAPGYPSEAVRFCDYVSDADLQGLYATVGLFVSTSLMEGFGLPQLEAMAAGCVVVAAANSAVIEVVGDGGRLVKGWRPEEWIDAIDEARRQSTELKVLAGRRLSSHDLAQACRQVSQAILLANADV
jgi:glycosyltransferase involved in cell wall biosynthesis